MNSIITYGIIFVMLLVLELLYFQIADKFNIIDKPNERSSHSTIVLRGGGIIFLLGMWVWSAFFGFQYPWFLAAVTLAGGVSFVDDIRSLPYSVRLVVQFVAMGLMFYQFGILYKDMMLMVAVAMFVCVGATNIINFMDGINGITSGYAGVVLVSILMADAQLGISIDRSLCYVTLLAVVVFAMFNFRPRGKERCFAGDVGSISIAIILLFLIVQIIVQTSDPTWLALLLVYGMDGCLTIIHRIMLHENPRIAHRKHAFQLMANELGMSHIKVSLIYMTMQFVVSFGFVWICAALASYLNVSLIMVHWIYLIIAMIVFTIAYIVFMKKYYHLHEPSAGRDRACR